VGEETFEDSNLRIYEDMDSQELKALWDNYRVSKAFGTQFDAILEQAIFYKVSEPLEFEYWLGEIHVEEPRAGRPYWTETFEPPPWFGRIVGETDFGEAIHALEMARGERRHKVRGKRCRRR
jgi:hypothetical protein